MAIPRGYKRNSSGFLDPVGRVPSGTSSGPGRFGLADKGHRREAEKKMLASFGKAQKAHEGVMAKITSAENATFKRLNDALIASREVDAKNKDALGNAMPPSAQTQYLTAQMGSHLQNRSQKATGLDARKSGVTPEQEGELKKGPGGPGGGRYDIGGSDYIPGIPGSRDLLQRGDSLEPGDPSEAPGEPEVFPMDTKVTHKSGQEITLTGQQRMGPNGPEYLARTADGREDWVPRSSFEVIEEAGDGAGLKSLERFYAPKHRTDPDRFVI